MTILKIKSEKKHHSLFYYTVTAETVKVRCFNRLQTSGTKAKDARAYCHFTGIISNNITSITITVLILLGTISDFVKDSI